MEANYITILYWFCHTLTYFLEFKPEFGNKEFVIWTTISSWSCFADCIELLHLWLQRISSIGFWYQPSGDVHGWVFSCGVGRGCWKNIHDQYVLLTNSISLCPASFCTPRPNLPVIPGSSWLPTFAFHSPIMKRTSFGGIVSRRSFRSS